MSMRCAAPKKIIYSSLNCELNSELRRVGSSLSVLDALSVRNDCTEEPYATD